MENSPGVSRRVVALTAGGAAVGVVIGLGMLLAGNVGLGLFFLVGPPAMGVVNLLAVRSALARRVVAGPQPSHALSGRMLSPTWSRTSGESMSWTGGANTASDLGRVNASYPLAVLTVTGQVLDLRLRPRLIALFFGVRPLVWGVGEISRLYPVRGRLAGGVAVEVVGAPLTYFWTSEQADVLTELARRGLPVDWAERQLGRL